MMAKPAQKAIDPFAAACDSSGRLRGVERFGQMRQPSTFTNRRPVVLLAQRLRDDGLEMYAEFLHYYGLAPLAVSNATDALRCAREADIIVTGITLDGRTDGVELVSRLRCNAATMHKPIIVLTACAWRRARERAERAGCDVFLLKPCLPNALLREVLLLLPQFVHDMTGSPTQKLPRI
ncbi:MAG: response regulator [Acidobacteria bacterium]|nr:MAG: response regulator [Acidobacteriota bacterium]